MYPMLMEIELVKILFSFYRTPPPQKKNKQKKPLDQPLQES